MGHQEAKDAFTRILNCNSLIVAKEIAAEILDVDVAEYFSEKDLEQELSFYEEEDSDTYLDTEFGDNDNVVMDDILSEFK